MDYIPTNQQTHTSVMIQHVSQLTFSLFATKTFVFIYFTQLLRIIFCSFNNFIIGIPTPRHHLFLKSIKTFLNFRRKNTRFAPAQTFFCGAPLVAACGLVLHNDVTPSKMADRFLRISSFREVRS